MEDTIFQKRSITKYEIPQYIPDIPEGFSLFCTLWEASKVKQYMLMSQEELDKLNIKENYDKQEKENNLEEPIPKSNFCYVCHTKFDNYLFHIETQVHKNNLSEETISFNKIVKNTFKRINKYWNIPSEEVSYDSNNEESSVDVKSNIDENSDNNIKVKHPILFSSVISLLNDDINNKNEENDLENKENIDINEKEIVFENFKYNYGNNYNIKDNTNNKKRDFTHFKLLKRKRITFEVIRYESPNKSDLEIKRDYFYNLNRYKTKKFIGNISVFFK